MNSRNLVICDREAEYAARLADYLVGKRELALQVKICESPEQVSVICKETPVDILLLDERIKFGDQSLKDVGKVLYLTASKDHSAESEELIFRYQSVEEICAVLMQGWSGKEKEKIWRPSVQGKRRMIGFYSPVHRLGQTSLAIQKGIELAKEANVLYINMEPYAGIGGYFVQEREKNLSMLLYYAKQETGNPAFLITTLIRQMQGLDYIPPTECPEDLKTVTVEEWMWLFREILDRSIYEVLILDLGDSVQGLFEILKQCDEVYMMTANDRSAAAKIRQYEEMLCRHGYGSVWERMIRCDIRRRTKEKNTGKTGSVPGSRR